MPRMLQNILRALGRIERPGGKVRNAVCWGNNRLAAPCLG